jgi:hypothetical protein
MDQQRGRSPSGGQHQPHINHGQSQSPQNFQESINPVGLGLGLQSSNSSNNQQYSNGFSHDGLPAYDNNFLNTQQGQQFNQGSLLDPTFVQSQDFASPPAFEQQFKQENNSTYGQQSYTDELLNTNNFNQGDFNLYGTPGAPGEQFDNSFYSNNNGQQASGQSINPADIMSDRSSPQPYSAPTPPSLLHSDSQGAQSSSAHHSPSFQQTQFPRSPGHSRNASLAPESAAYPNAQLPTDWSMVGGPQFTTHRRSPSEYSDVSASSAAASPNLPHHDTFDSIENNHSPLMNAQDPSLYQEVLQIGNFSLSDPQIQQGASPRRGLSPAHTPSISPRLGPQQVPMINQQANFMLSMDGMNNGYQQSSGNDMYNNQQDQYGQRIGSADMGQAQQMVPPEINVEFAPASRQNSFEPPKPGQFDQDALTPPERGKKF